MKSETEGQRARRWLRALIIDDIFNIDIQQAAALGCTNLHVQQLNVAFAANAVDLLVCVCVRVCVCVHQSRPVQETSHMSDALSMSRRYDAVCMLETALCGTHA